MNYKHQYTDGTTIHYPLGKVVCIGRNYAEHAKELNNPAAARCRWKVDSAFLPTVVPCTTRRKSPY